MKPLNIIIAGGGTMGTSLVQIFSQNAFPVTLYSRRRETLERAKDRIAINQKALVQQNILSGDESEALVRRISFSDDKACFADADLVIENITEDMEAKKRFWQEISRLVPETAVLATNTSGLSITEMSGAVHLPERFDGMHWFNPPHIVQLIEVTKGEQTSDATADFIMELSKAVGKKPIKVQKDIPGFIANRLQYALLREAAHLVEEGAASMEEVDLACSLVIGMRYACLGPFRVVDMGGVDIFNSVSNYLFADLCDDKDGSRLMQQLVAEGKLGVKSGEGFYPYRPEEIPELIQERDTRYIQMVQCMDSFEKKPADEEH